MRLGIHARLFIWLILVALPIAAACVFTVKVIENRLTERVHAGLENDHRLEAARIEAALAQYRQYAKGLSYTPQLRTLIDQIHAQGLLSTESVTDQILSASKSTNETIAQIKLPESSLQQRLQRLIDYIQSNAQQLDSGLIDLKIITSAGLDIGHTSMHSWFPRDKSLIDESINKT